MKQGLIAFAAFCLLLATFISSAQAQGIDPSKIKKIPHYQAYTDAQFEAESQIYKFAPQGDRYLAYSIRLPQGWQKAGTEKLADTSTNAQKSAGHHIFGKVATYFGPQVAEFPSRIEIQALALDYDISARNWFLNYIVSNGFTLEGMEEINKTRIEGLYILVEGDTSYVVRTIAQMNGTRMVLASYYLPEANWDKEKAIQEKTIESFQFDNVEQLHIEQMHTYAFLDLLHFDYPASWRLLAPNVDSIDGMDARLVSSTDKEVYGSHGLIVERTLNGQIDMHIVSTAVDTTLAQEVKDLRKTVQATGLTIGNLIEAPSNYKLHSQVYFSRVEIYSARTAGSAADDQEFWLAIMIEDRYYYIISMITPSRNNNFLLWARNTEAFQSVIESVRL